MVSGQTVGNDILKYGKYVNPFIAAAWGIKKALDKPPVTIVDSISTSVKAVTDAYISISQDFSQSAEIGQVISVNCTEGKKAGGCLACETRWKGLIDKNPSAIPSEGADKFIEKSCSYMCDCNLSDIDLSQRININWKIFAEASTSDKFQTLVKDSLAQQAKAKSKPLNFGNKESNINKVINNVYTHLKSDTMQKALQALQDQQQLIFSGAGSLASVTMTQASNYIANTLLLDSQMTDLLTEMETNVLQASTEVTNAGLAELALLLLRIIAFVIVLIVLFYSINLVFEIYSLYAR